jgi:hypothetical protein
MEVKTDNAAGRLYSLLNIARQQSPEISLWEVWEKTLKASNNTDLSTRIVYLKELVQDVQDIVDESGLKKELYLSRHQEIVNLVNCRNYDQPWKNLLRTLDEPTLTNLAHLSEVLDKRFREETISKETFDSLILSIEELLKKVSESDLDREIQQLIIAKLTTLLNAIYAYEIRGIKGFREAYTAIIGEIVLNQEALKKVSDKEEVKSFWTIIMKASDVITKVYTFYKITQETPNLLTYVERLIK